MTAIREGYEVPEFLAKATGGREVKLSELRGYRVVLYFYPRDNTPGCTTEGEDFRDHFKAFAKANTIIFGVSRDTLASHETFKAKFECPFELIADPDEALCLLFDVMRQKNRYGKKVWGIERSTFLIDENAILLKEWRKVKVSGHVEEVLAAVKIL